MIVLVTRATRLIRAGAVTVWPFMFIHPDRASDVLLLSHEEIHGNQQRPWVLTGSVMAAIIFGWSLVAGVPITWFYWLLLAFPFMWHLLYLLCLPVWWNPWRYNWEWEAFAHGTGLSDEEIEVKLSKAPYYLNGMKTLSRFNRLG